MIKEFLQFKFRIGLKTDVNENASRLKKSRWWAKLPHNTLLTSLLMINYLKVK